MPEIKVIRPVLGACHSIVCAPSESTDSEILEAANTQNPSGIRNGWSRVIRIPEDESEVNKVPLRCINDNNKIHYVLVC